MSRSTKRRREMEKKSVANKGYSFSEAIDTLKACPPVKFDQSVEIAVKLGVDSKKSDQMVRGTVPLPSGTGKKMTIVALAKGDKAEEAKQAGADFVGSDELVAKIAEGWTSFDALVVTPDMMREVGKLGKILGPRGLMPTPKAGTVSTDIARAVKEIRSGKIEFKSDSHGVVNCAVGKLSFETSAILNNIKALITALHRAKPVAAKGQYFESLYLSSTMGPGLKIELSELEVQ